MQRPTRKMRKEIEVVKQVESDASSNVEGSVGSGEAHAHLLRGFECDRTFE
jgi:hypothetical protein